MEILKDNNGNILYKLDDEEMERSDSFWTPDRIEKARPIQMAVNGLDLGSAGEVTVSEGGIVEPADTSVPPYCCGGRLLASGSKKNDLMIGSAQVCGNPRILLTAGHCAYSQKYGWHENINFTRAFGGKKTERYLVKAILIKQFWHVMFDGGYDYALLIIDKACEHKLDFELESKKGELESIGYPNNFGSTKKMQKVTGWVKYRNAHMRYMVNNPFSHGASGGAWLDNDKIVGVNSALQTLGPDLCLTSPDFDYEFQTLYDYAEQNL